MIHPFYLRYQAFTRTPFETLPHREGTRCPGSCPCRAERVTPPSVTGDITFSWLYGRREENR